MNKLPLPQIKKPCHNNWDVMTGDVQRRFCSSCQKLVHNLEEYPADVAEELLDSRRDICIRMRVNRAGRFVTLPESNAKLATMSVKFGRRLMRIAVWFIAFLIPTSLAGCIMGTRTTGSPRPPSNSTQPADHSNPTNSDAKSTRCDPS